MKTRNVNLIKNYFIAIKIPLALSPLLYKLTLPDTLSSQIAL